MTTKILEVVNDDRSIVDELNGYEAYKSLDSGCLYHADLDKVPEEMSIPNQQRMVNIIMKCMQQNCTYFRFR